MSNHQSDLEALVEAKVKQVILSAFDYDFRAEPQTLPAKAAYPTLGYSSIRQLYKDIEDGLLRLGVEVEDRRRPGKLRPRYFINLPAARKRLQQPPSKRA